jgi:hypothetical protein
MDSKERQLFTLMWSLLVKHHQLLGDVLPLVRDIVDVLGDGSTPSPEQLRTWKERYDEMNQTLYELTANFESLRQVADPLFGFDA